MDPIVKISPAAQNYAWGMPADKSEVAKLLAADGGSVDPKQNYAELWFGTHPSGPAKLADGGKLLSDFVAAHAEAHLGKGVAAKFGTAEGLPFLLKILSVAKALSIQAHPDRRLAEDLHRRHPDLYKDPNHKPEIAIALTDFEALCEFRPVSEIAAHLRDVSELAATVGADAVAKFEATHQSDPKHAVRNLLHSLMTAAPALVHQQLQHLVSRLSAKSPKTPLDEVVLRVHAQYPGDVGVFNIYLLNYLVLRPGEALFLGPNEPHAYLSGECVECMANSDNVVRAGLTPKHKDVPTLVSMLTYSTGMPKVLRGHPVDSQRRIYRPPVAEFQVEQISLKAGETYSITAAPFPSILLALHGAGQLTAAPHPPLAYARGSSFFVSAAAPSVTLLASADSVLFLASCNHELVK